MKKLAQLLVKAVYRNINVANIVLLVLTAPVWIPIVLGLKFWDIFVDYADPKVAYVFLDGHDLQVRYLREIADHKFLRMSKEWGIYLGKL